MKRPRKTTADRTTRETAVRVRLNLDGSGKTAVKTSVPFLDHLVASLGKHAMWDLELTAKSLDGIVHHLVEDVAIALAQAFDKTLGSRDRIRRFGHTVVPMDEALALAAVDLVRRPFFRISLKLGKGKLEGLTREDVEHFFDSLAANMNACIHVMVRYGSNDHHKVEAAIKALAVALREASALDTKRNGLPTTKGAM